MKQQLQTAASAQGAHSGYKIPLYAQMQGEKRVRMDEIIVEMNGGGAMAAFNFCAGPMEKLDEVSRAVMTQTGMDSSLMANFVAVEKAVSEIDAGRIQQRLGTLLAKAGHMAGRNKAALAASGAALVLLGPLSALGIGTAAAGYQRVQKWRAGPTIDDAADEMRSEAIKIGDIIAALENADEALPETLGTLDRFETTLADTHEDILLHVGAGREKLRRLREEEIPAAQAAQDADPSPGGARTLRTLHSQEAVLAKRLENIQTGLSVMDACEAMLDDMDGLIKTAGIKTKDHLQHSAPLWRMLLGMAGVQLAAHEIARANTEADAYGGNLVLRSAELHRATSLQVSQSAQQGTFDPRQIETALNRLENIGADMTALGQRKTALAGAQARLEQRAGEFRQNMAALREQRAALIAPNGSSALAALPAPEPPRLGSNQV